MPKIVSVHSFRHGTGKSSLTANLAVTIAQQGQRVGIIDVDINFPPGICAPGVHTFFGIDIDKSNSTLSDYILGNSTLEEIVRDVSFVLGIDRAKDSSVSGSLYFIPGNLKMDREAVIARELYDVGLLSAAVNRLILSLNLDCVLIDIYSGINEQTLLPLSLSDILILLLCLDQPDFQGTAVTVDVANRLEIPQTWLLVNQMTPSFDSTVVRQQLEMTYELPVVGILPWVEEMRLLSSSNEIFCLRYRDHVFTQGVRAIARQILSSKAVGKKKVKTKLPGLDIWKAKPRK